MSIKNRLLLVYIMLNISVVSLAQQAHSSPFSYIGIGDIYQSGLAYNRSMGGLGIGIRSSFYLNGVNPAALTAMDTMSFTFEFGASGVYSIIETPNINEPSMSGSIDYMAIGFPITRWLKTSVGFTPYSKVGYNLTEYVKAENEGKELFTLKRDIKGEGGLNQLYLSNGILIKKKFSLGITMSYVFGQITNTTSDIPSTYNPSVSSYTEELVTRINDFSYSLGLQYNDKLKEKYNYTIGVVYGADRKLSTKTSVLMRSFSTGHPSGGDTLEVTDNVNSAIDLPMYYGFGFSFGTEKLVVGFDFLNSAWNSVSVTNKDEQYVDAQRYVLGLEYIPKPRTATKYIHRIRYRLAGRFEKSYMLINNEPLKDVGITFGLGLPMKRSKTTMNLSLDIGQGGTFNAESLNQTYFKFNIDLSLHDVWFIKRKYD